MPYGLYFDIDKNGALCKPRHRTAAGEPLEQRRHGEVVNGDYRYLQAIGTAEACLGCHGSNIKPQLLTLLDQHYPQDQARGFKEGDLRGAFSLRRPLDR